ncbi:MAG: hypothetical protein R3246_13195, partial [Acidimicrobiia bacterium]|nr:hypothetical protein [Acidimicrobiia bacterium]
MGALRRAGPTGAWAAAGVGLAILSLLSGWPAPIGIVVLGAVIGSLIAFISFGLVLIYRTDRIINFAGADIGATAAVLTVMLVSELELNYFLGVAIGLATAATLAGLIDIVVVRRFARAPRLVLTVATLALAQILVFVQLILPQAFSEALITPDFPTPFSGSFRIGDPHGTTGVLFDGNHILAIAMVPIVVVALGAFFRLTRVGIASRASAENAERA